MPLWGNIVKIRFQREKEETNLQLLVQTIVKTGSGVEVGERYKQMGIAASQFFLTLPSPNPSTDSQSSYIAMLIEMG